MAPTDPLQAPVFLGVGVKDGAYQGSGWEQTGLTEVRTATVDSMLDTFEQMDQVRQRRLLLLLAIGGFAGGVSLEDAPEASRDMTLQEAMEAYLSLLNTAAAAYQAGRRVTPEQMLEQAVAFRLPPGADWDGSYAGLRDILGQNDIDVSGVDDVAGAEEEKEPDLSGTRTTTSNDTQTSTSVSRDIMDPNDAMALTRALLQRELGRDPTKAEFEDFISAVQAAQRANPTKTTTKTSRDTRTETTTNKKGRVIDSDTDTDLSTSSTTHAGITQAGIEDILLRRVRRNPDWAEWQAVGTYAPALFQALGATVPGV